MKTGALLGRIGRVLHPPDLHNDRVWASRSLAVPITETVNQLNKMVIWGMMNCVWPLTPSYPALRQKRHIGQLRGGSAEGDGGDDEAMRRRTELAMRRRR